MSLANADLSNCVFGKVIPLKALRYDQSHSLFHWKRWQLPREQFMPVELNNVDFLGAKLDRAVLNGVNLARGSGASGLTGA